MKYFVLFTILISALVPTIAHQQWNNKPTATKFNYTTTDVITDQEVDIDFCSGCMDVVKMISYYAEQNYTYMAIEKIVVGACSTLGPGYSSVCKFVADYGVKAILNKLKTMDPAKVCQSLRICVKIQNSAKCSVCKIVISQLVDYVTQGHTVEEIKKFVKKICGSKLYVGSNICTTIVEIGIDKLIEFIRTAHSSQEVCTWLKLC